MSEAILNNLKVVQGKFCNYALFSHHIISLFSWITILWQAYALYTTTVTPIKDSIFTDSTFWLYLVIIRNLMITHYKVPNFAQFSHRKYISDAKIFTDHNLKHNTLTSFGRHFYALQGSKVQKIYCDTCDHSQEIIQAFKRCVRLKIYKSISFLYGSLLHL